ncbi:MAG: type II toxin-antitoxin system RelE/ParE family toxin [Anaerobutyricum sp.]
MQEYKIILTWEAIYDVTDIADYIEEEFGQQRADRFQSDLKEQMQNLSQFSTAFPRTQILYRGYSIHKDLFRPLLFFIL